MDWIDPEPAWLICPAFADELIWGQTLECFETAAVIIGCNESIEVLS
jgi:hypothetical protein